MLVTTKIDIDLQKAGGTITVRAVQGDKNTRCIEAVLTSGGAEWMIPDGATVAMRYRKPDMTGGYYDTMPDGTSAWSVHDNVISMQVAPQMLTVAGHVFAQLELICKNAVLGTFTIHIHVEADPSVGVLESEDYINWVQWMEDEIIDRVNMVLASGSDFTGPVGPAGYTPVRGIDYWTEADQKDLVFQVQQTTAPMIIDTGSGNPIELTDAADRKLQGLKLCGKTIQSVVPTMGSPAALQNIGAGGSVHITVGKQTVSVSTPNGLRGISTVSGGNYTDENNQSWICDEMDFARGKLVQRIGVWALDGSEDWSGGTCVTAGYNRYLLISVKTENRTMPKSCSHFQVINQSAYGAAAAGLYYGHEAFVFDFAVSDKDIPDLAGWKAWLAEQSAAGTPLTVHYVLDVPIETDLPADECAAWAALRTSAPNTTVYNDAQAYMSVDYVADTKRYIEKRLAELSMAM